MVNSFRYSLAASVVTSVLALPVNAADNLLQLEEVVVTARKVEESAQTIPMSVSSLSGDTLKSTGFSNLSEITGLVPNVIFTGEGQANGTFSIRGVRTSSNNAGFESGNGLYVDEVYVGESSVFETATMDLGSIEILRGPQGTLYGRNVIGGLINVHTKNPGPDTEASASVSIGNYSQQEYKGVLGGTLVEDRVFGRLTAMKKSRDGYLEDFNNGDDYNSEDSWAVRGKLLFTPSEDLSILLSADYYEDDNNDGVMDPVSGFLVDGGFDTTALSDRTVGLDFSTFTEREVSGVSARVNYQYNGHEITSVTAFRENTINNLQDQDFSVLPLLITGVNTELSQFSQELRLTKADADRLNYTVGLYYFDQQKDALTTVILDDFLPAIVGLNPGDGVGTGLTTGNIDGSAYAIFGSMSYDLTDELILDLGLRWSYEDKEMFYEQVLTPGSFLFQALEFETDIPGFSEDYSEGAWSGNISLSYLLNEESMMYGTISRGFKAGGFNATLLGQVPMSSLSFDAEFVINYEVGFKSELFDRRLRFNVAGFYMDYTDKQEQTRVDFEFKVGNAAEAETKGIEVEFVALPLPNLMLSGGIGYTDAEYTDWPDCDGLGTFNCAGLPLSNAPEHTASLVAQYDIPMESFGSRVFINLSADYRDKSYTDIALTEAYTQEARTLVNARLGIEDDDGKWSITLWGRNITDKEVNESAWDILGLADVVYLSPPRTYGIQLQLSL